MNDSRQPGFRVISLSQEVGKMIDDDITPASETQPGRRATNRNKVAGHRQ